MLKIDWKAKFRMGETSCEAAHPNHIASEDTVVEVRQVGVGLLPGVSKHFIAASYVHC